MFFSHKSIFPGRTLREHLGLAATIANSNILFQMRIFKFVSVLAYFATTMVCDFPIFILIFFRCNFHAKSVMHAFVWTDITIITIILTKSLLYHDIISSSQGFRDIFHSLPHVEILVLNKPSNWSTGQRLWPIRVRGLPCLSSDWTVGDS